MSNEFNYDVEKSLLIGQIENFKKLLKDTDWYYSRREETNEQVPDEIIIKRKEAREFIRANKNV